MLTMKIKKLQQALKLELTEVRRTENGLATASAALKTAKQTHQQAKSHLKAARKAAKVAKKKAKVSDETFRNARKALKAAQRSAERIEKKLARLQKKGAPKKDSDSEVSGKSKSAEKAEPKTNGPTTAGGKSA